MLSRRKSVRNSLICGLIAIATFIGIGLAASAQEAPGSAEIDYVGFMDLTGEVFELREDRFADARGFQCDGSGTKHDYSRCAQPVCL